MKGHSHLGTVCILGILTTAIGVSCDRGPSDPAEANALRKLRKPDSFSVAFDKAGHVYALDLTSWGEIDDSDLAKLVAFRYLVEVNLTGCVVTSEGLSRLSELPKLKSLALRSTEISTSDLSFLVSLPQLEILDISDTPIGENGISQLSGLKHLKILLLSAKMTENGLKQLQQALPNCQISIQPYRHRVRTASGNSTNRA